MTPNAEQLKDLIEKFEAKGYTPNWLIARELNLRKIESRDEDYSHFAHLILADIQKWCREKGTDILITTECMPPAKSYLWQIIIYDSCEKDGYSNRCTGLYGDNGEYSEYEQALYEALKEVINQNLIDNGKRIKI